MSIEEKKNTCRQEVKALRDALTGTERGALSKRIIDRLRNDEQWKTSETVMIYCGCRTEVETATLFADALRSKKKVLVPCIPDNQDSIIPVRINTISDLSDTCRYGMKQPKRELCKPFTGKIHMVIVPGIVFGLNGARIGSGKGYFDSFLAKYTYAVRAGLAFSCQVKEHVVQAEYDIKMHKIFTEHEVIVTHAV